MDLTKNQSAQFMLLAGFIIAIGLVITTTVLNSIIFEVNTAVGAGAEPSKNEIVNLLQITRDEVRNAYWWADYTGGGINAFDRHMNSYNWNISKMYALHGAGINVSWDTSNWGNFPFLTENGTTNGASNWTVMESVNEISEFDLWNVSGSVFKVNIVNQTTGVFLWSLELNGADSIIIGNSTGTSTYSVNFENIDLLNASYNLTGDVMGNSKKIEFIEGAAARGRFNIKGNTSFGSGFTRARDYVLNATIEFSTSRMHANITIPVSVPWGRYEI